MGEKKLTLFELHFEGPLRVGPSFGDDPEPATEAVDEPHDTSADFAGDSGETATAGAGETGRQLAIGLLLVLVLAFALRKLLGSAGASSSDDTEMVDIDE